MTAADIALRNPDPARAREAARSLADSPDGIAAVTAALTDEDDHVRRRAALALAVVGPAAAGAVPALREAMADPLWTVREAAAEALAAVGPAAEVRPLLVAVSLTDPEPLVRDAAARGAAGLPGDPAAEYGPAVLTGRDRARRKAARSLGWFLPTAAESVVPLLTRLTLDPHPRVRRAALLALGRQLRE